MRAAVYSGNRSLAIRDVAEPECGSGQVRIRVAHNGICGTDLHEYYAGPIFAPGEPHPLTGRQMPLVLGHEFSGTVEAVGDGVAHVAVGDRVAVEPLHTCGRCPPCREGNYNVCQVIGFHGLMADGGMAERTTVEAGMVHPLPEGVGLELGALVEPMAVAYHAAKRAEVGPGDTAVVFGAGPIGIGLWFALRGLGVSRVIVFEPAQQRREALQALGAEEVVDPSAVDPGAHVRQRTGGRGAAAVYDAAGVRPAVEAALDCVADRRPVVAVAIYERPLETSLIQLVMKEANIRGSLCYTGADYREVLDLMSRGHYDPTGWVEHIPLEAVVAEGFEALHRGTKMKVLVDP